MTSGIETLRQTGPRQLPLFSRDEMIAATSSCAAPRSRDSDCAAAYEGAAPPEGRAPGGHHMVALWHDRAWAPLRLFRRGDGATIVVFAVGRSN